MSQPDFSNLQNCIEEARQAALDQDPGPPEPLQFHVLRGRLQAARAKMPPIYLDAVFNPYVRALDELGENGFNQILFSDLSREREAGLMLDIAQAILQRGEGFEPKAGPAFQEVVADLYDGFLSAEDRRGVLPPDNETIAPLVKFGNPDFGPYTWSVDATENFGLTVGIVNLPPSNARHGLLAWGTRQADMTFCTLITDCWMRSASPSVPPSQTTRRPEVWLLTGRIASMRLLRTFSVS
jgi:hypothetical protein